MSADVQNSGIACRYSESHIHRHNAAQESQICYSVTENGFAVKDENVMPLEEAIADHDRVQYFRGNMTSLIAAVLEDGVAIKAYFGWSM